MTITATIHTSQETGDGTTTAFTVSYRILKNSYLRVWSQASGATSATRLVELTDYTIANVSSEEQTVTFTTAPASGTTITFERFTRRDQEADYALLRKLPAESHELFFDKLTMMIQELINREEDLIITNPTNPGDPNSPVTQRFTHVFPAKILTEASAGVYTWEEVDGGLVTFTGARTGSTARSTGGCENVANGIFVTMLEMVDSAGGLSHRFLLGGQCGGGGDPDIPPTPENILQFAAVALNAADLHRVNLTDGGYTDNGDAWTDVLLSPTAITPFDMVTDGVDGIYLLSQTDGIIRKFNFSGTRQYDSSDQMGEFNTLTQGRGIAYCPTNDVIYVVSMTQSADAYGNDIIKKITPSTGATVASKSLDSPAVALKGPRAVDVDSSGNVYVGGNKFQISGLTGSGPAHVYKLNAAMDTVLYEYSFAVDDFAVMELVVMPSGKLLVAQNAILEGLDPRVSVHLLNADGTLDNTFVTNTSDTTTFFSIDIGIDEFSNIYIYTDQTTEWDGSGGAEASLFKLDPSLTLLKAVDLDVTKVPNTTSLRFISVHSSQQIFLGNYNSGFVIVDWTTDASPVLNYQASRGSTLNLAFFDGIPNP